MGLKSLQRAAIVSPLQSLMMTPMLEIPSRSDEAPSTFILNTLGGGGDQQQESGCLEVERTVYAASEKSSKDLLAICQTYEGEEHLPSWMVLFLLYQIAQATVKKDSKT